MSATDMANGAYKVDDTFDDAEAAYKEVMGRTDEKVTPAAKPSTPDPDEVAGSDEPTSITTGKEAKGKAAKEADETPASSDEGRDDKGRFKSKSDRADAAGGKAQQGTGEGEPPPSPVAANAAPPPSFSVKSKAQWNNLPQEVRADIIKREAEIQNGLGALKDYKDLKPWAELAAQKGTTLTAALKSYVGIENLLRKDPGAGIATIAQNCGLNQAQAAELFHTLAQKFGHGAQPAADDPVAQAVSPFLKPLMDKIGGLESQLKSREQVEAQARMSSLDTALKTMEADAAYPFLNDLYEDMTFLLEHGRVPSTGNILHDLKAAYDTAARLNPQVHEAQIEMRLATERETLRRAEQDEAARARAASRSVTGSKMPGTVTTQATGNGVNAADDIMADVQAAYRAVAHR